MPFKPGHSLPSSRRIKCRADFEQALHAHCLTNNWFSLYLRENKCGYTRLGLIVSKRTMPTAVARNFTKRMIREVFRCNFSVDYPLDVIVRAKRQFGFKSSAEGRLALIRLFQSAQQ